MVGSEVRTTSKGEDYGSEGDRVRHDADKAGSRKYLQIYGGEPARRSAESPRVGGQGRRCWRGNRVLHADFRLAIRRIDGTPDFAIGINIVKAFGSGQGAGTHMHMYVDEKGDRRSVQLIAKHGLLDSGRAARIARLFFEKFQAADSKLQVTDSNI